MSRFPRLTGKELLAALRRAGFDVVRIAGSHYHLYKPGADLVTIPVHAGEIIKPKTLKSILDQAGMTMDELSLPLILFSEMPEDGDIQVNSGLDDIKY